MAQLIIDPVGCREAETQEDFETILKVRVLARLEKALLRLKEKGEFEPPVVNIFNIQTIQALEERRKPKFTVSDECDISNFSELYFKVSDEIAVLCKFPKSQ